MLRRFSVLALLVSLTATVIGVAPAQAAPPEVTEIWVSNAKIYPAINTAERPGSTTIVVDVADPMTVARLEVRNALTSVVKQFPFTGSAVTWNGRDTSGGLVPAGTYTIYAVNEDEQAAEAAATVVVSRQRLIRKTYTKVVLPSQFAAKAVGKCSTLRNPSKRGWKGSRGYYSNTKCKSQAWQSTAVITAHITRFPVAERYVDLRVDTYGGAAKAKPRSRGVIEYFKLGQGWTATKSLTSKVAWHNGPTRGPSGHVDSGRYFGWRFIAAYKSQYDVAKFRVVVHYDVLSAS